nr:MAG TPA: hypothetical protein [Caudoviricetes sp.]
MQPILPVHIEPFCSWRPTSDSTANDNSNYYYLAGLYLTKHKEFPQAIFIFYFNAWLTIVNRPREQKKIEKMRPKYIGLALYA